MRRLSCWVLAVLLSFSNTELHWPAGEEAVSVLRLSCFVLAVILSCDDTDRVDLSERTLLECCVMQLRRRPSTLPIWT